VRPVPALFFDEFPDRVGDLGITELGVAQRLHQIVACRIGVQVGAQDPGALLGREEGDRVEAGGPFAGMRRFALRGRLGLRPSIRLLPLGADLDRAALQPVRTSMPAEPRGNGQGIVSPVSTAAAAARELLPAPLTPAIGPQLT
jgi:hypothetical protein